MSNQSDIIKSNRYGLNVVLDEQPDWDTIKKEVAEKFSASAKFFGNAQMALCFQGRSLSTAEEEELVEVIEASCQIQVVCLVDENQVTEQTMKQAVERQTGRAEAPEDHDLTNLQDGRFYKGTLRSGQDVYKRQYLYRSSQHFCPASQVLFQYLRWRWFFPRRLYRM